MGEGTLRRFRALTGRMPEADGKASLLDVDGIEGPAARLRVTPESVELTFLAERRTGFLNWLATDAAGHVYRLMCEHERWAVVEDLIEAWPEPDKAETSDESGSPYGREG